MRNLFLNIFYLFSKKKGFHKNEISLSDEFYSPGGKKENKTTIVVMIDGRQLHGGFADRIRGIVTIYQFCKDRKIPFYINYTYPFELNEFLEPNKYDWRIDKSNLVYNLNAAQPCLLYEWMYPHKFHKWYLKLLCLRRKQLHVYTNSHFEYEKFSIGFNELFKPVPNLKVLIDKHKKSIGDKYNVMVFRFQQLLGDFKEGNNIVLSEEKRQILISKCINKIRIMYNGKKLLITSDSITFINKVKSLDFVYVIPGSVVHIDYTENAPLSTYMKTFLDFFLIANADIIYLLLTDNMYKSGFPKTASKVFNRPFEVICF